MAFYRYNGLKRKFIAAFGAKIIVQANSRLLKTI